MTLRLSCTLVILDLPKAWNELAEEEKVDLENPVLESRSSPGHLVPYIALIYIFAQGQDRNKKGWL
jgi:hypothetical protein